ncbi:MAG: phospholipase A [Pseudomonadota bacterium]
MHNTRWRFTLIGALLLTGTLSAQDYGACLINQVERSAGQVTVEMVRKRCADRLPPGGLRSELGDGRVAAEVEAGSLRGRITVEERLEASPFQLTPHAPNYIAYSSMDSANQSPFAPLVEGENPVENEEAVFQISFKAPIAKNLFGTELDAYFAYTSKAWWQIANDDFSSPFRETNYQPELFIRSNHARKLLGMTLEGWSLGYAHESNGREQALSRSWDRFEARAGLQLESQLSVFVRTWYRLPEDSADDDNPDLYRYRGYGDLRAIWTPSRNTFTVLLNPATEGMNFELTWSYPINRVFRIYASYFDGYGESLIDYDFRLQRFSLGVALNDFLTRY